MQAPNLFPQSCPSDKPLQKLCPNSLKRLCSLPKPFLVIFLRSDYLIAALLWMILSWKCAYIFDFLLFGTHSTTICPGNPCQVSENSYHHHCHAMAAHSPCRAWRMNSSTVLLGQPPTTVGENSWSICKRLLESVLGFSLKMFEG